MLIISKLQVRFSRNCFNLLKNRLSQNRGLGRRPHELRRHSDEFRDRQFDRQSAAKSFAAEEIQMHRMFAASVDLSRPRSHGREIRMHQFLCRRIRKNAAKSCRVSCRSGFV
jgi:hypothetical protein